MPKIHNIDPIYNSKSKILILGSFPSEKSRKEGFFYMHPQNRFWKLISTLLKVEFPITIDAKKQLLTENNIAVFDVIKSCDIVGSSDSSISNVVTNDIQSIIKASSIHAIYCNGNKAYELYKKYIIPNLPESFDITPILLPSTSPANAAYNLDALISSWKRILIPLKRDINKRYYSLNDYANDFYGKKLYKLSLDGGFTCPNRDGKIDTRGCIFCDGGGAGDFAGNNHSDGSKRILSQNVRANISDIINEQIEVQKELIHNKLSKSKTNGYIAYFQSFSNTYAPASKLREVYSAVANRPDIDIVSIATRPDCLGEDVLEVLSELRQKKEVWIELGLQTMHNSSAKYIRRGYDLKVYEKAVKQLSLIGIDHIIVHVILGLPNESLDMMLKTVDYVAHSGVNGIKLQLLHILKNTDLEREFANGNFSVLSEDEYMDILKHCLDILPKDMVVHRLSGDGNKKNLIAPLWSANKKHVLNRIKSL